jgi:hypothetical protein
MSSARLIPIIVLSSACGGMSPPRTVPSGPVDIRELWVEPVDLSDRNLLHGSGGDGQAPNPDATYEVISVDQSGYSRGYEVRDGSGTEWNVKLGPEAQPEVVASRILWAIGFHQPAAYYVPKWTLAGETAGVQGPARFRRESGEHKLTEWSWYENPFAATQPFKGLIVANLILNNWDWKTSNNRVYERAVEGEGPRRMYIVRDLGASLGKTTFPSILKWTPMRGMGQGTRNDLEGFEEQGFVKAVTGERVRFHYQGIHDPLVDAVTVRDVVWTCRLLARLSDQQWTDAFRAAGYSEAHGKRFIAKLKSKVAEGLRLATDAARTHESGRFRVSLVAP